MFQSIKVNVVINSNQKMAENNLSMLLVLHLQKMF